MIRHLVRDLANYLFKGCQFILMATQRIASASARGAVTQPKLSKNVLNVSNRLVPVVSSTTEAQKRWKSTPAIGIDTSIHKEREVQDFTSVAKDLHTGERKTDELDLTFLDHQAAFKSKTTWEVLRAYIVFNLCTIKPLVDHNEALMRMGKAVLGKKLFGAIMKQSFYGHFVAGEDRQSIKPAIHRMHSFGVKSILDYSVEEDVPETVAVKLEMDACVPDAEKDTHHEKIDTVPHKGDHTDGIKRYKAHEGFGDRRQMVNGARTYFYQNEAQCEKNMETFLRCIEAVADSTGSTGLAAIKITALGRPNLLMQLSEVIIRARRYYQKVSGEEGFVHEGKVDKGAFEKRFKEHEIHDGNQEVQDWLSNMTADKKGLIHMFSWSGLIDSNLLMKEAFQVPNLKTGKMENMIDVLTEKEEEQFRNMLTRLNTIMTAAKEMDVRCMIDAEQTYFQPAIGRLAMEMMKKYNTEKTIVFNTYQCYMKIAYHSLILDMEQAARQNFFFGAKLVRGAYMEQERARAEQLGYEDPINPDFEATSASYHRCLAECMRRMHELKTENMPQKVGIMVASHNADTIRFALTRMKELGIEPDERLICFGQLYGMCDNLSFPLGQAGYSVYKYVPYGPVNEVLPYLSRRARENGGMLTKLQTEKSLQRKELWRRLKTGQVFYKPQGNYVPVGFERDSKLLNTK